MIKAFFLSLLGIKTEKKVEPKSFPIEPYANLGRTYDYTFDSQYSERAVTPSEPRSRRSEDNSDIVGLVAGIAVLSALDSFGSSSDSSSSFDSSSSSDWSGGGGDFSGGGASGEW